MSPLPASSPASCGGSQPGPGYGKLDGHMRGKLAGHAAWKMKRRPWQHGLGSLHQLQLRAPQWSQRATRWLLGVGGGTKVSLRRRSSGRAKLGMRAAACVYVCRQSTVGAASRCACSPGNPSRMPPPAKRVRRGTCASKHARGSSQASDAESLSPSVLQFASRTRQHARMPLMEEHVGDATLGHCVAMAWQAC